jgi:hypothetical protein
MKGEDVLTERMNLQIFHNQGKHRQNIWWVHNDGGREAAGFKGITRDCGVRALSITSGLDYDICYDIAVEIGRKDRKTKLKNKSHPREGIYTPTFNRMLKHIEGLYGVKFDWVPTMGIGTGCRVHLTAHELPKGRLIANVSKHLVAVIDGIIHDTYDCSRGGTRCVYGYWLRVK